MTEHVQTFAPRPCPTCGEDGTFHKEKGYGMTCIGGSPHDPNCYSGAFQCTNGHWFAGTTQKVCECGWSGVKGCHISGHHKTKALEQEPPDHA